MSFRSNPYEQTFSTQTNYYDGRAGQQVTSPTPVLPQGYTYNQVHDGRAGLAGSPNYYTSPSGFAGLTLNDAQYQQYLATGSTAPRQAAPAQAQRRLPPPLAKFLAQQNTKQTISLQSGGSKGRRNRNPFLVSREAGSVGDASTPTGLNVPL